MAVIVKPNTFAPNTVIRSAQVNDNYDTIYNDYNGNVTDTNIAAGANIALTKIIGTAVNLSAIQTLTNKTLTAPVITGPTITGIVAGGATYTAPTITSPSITGTVAGSATYTTPTLTVPVIADYTSGQHNHQAPAGGGVLDINLATTGTLSASRGGSGAASFTAHGVIIGNGAGAFNVTAVGATGTVLHGNTGLDPTYSAVSLTADVTDTLPVGRGGTGVVTSTGSGSVVLNTSPIFSGTITAGGTWNFTGLVNIAGSNPPTASDQIGSSSVAKAFARFTTDAGGAVVSTNQIFNITSIAREGATSNYIVTFNRVMVGTTYNVVVTATDTPRALFPVVHTKAAGSFKVVMYDTNATLHVDNLEFNLAVFGLLS